jgi:AraC-like DNA-binding protein
LLSTNKTTLGLGIRLMPGCRQWMTEVETGRIGIFRPGDEHEAMYTPGSVYAAVTLPDEELEAVAGDMGLVLDRKQLGGSRISRRVLASDQLARLQREFERIHTAGVLHGAKALNRFLLECLIRHVARDPRPQLGARDTTGHSRIVARAQRFILENLDAPLAISAIARAAFASQSTLYRAFHEVLDETPQSFVSKMRLNRIRRDLATQTEAHCTIAMLANKWGVGELGRFSGRYRELFGELPSETRHRASPSFTGAPLP